MESFKTNNSSLSVFRNILSHTKRKHKAMYVLLLVVSIFIGFWESMTIVWIASFASWMVNIEKLQDNHIYQLIYKINPDLIPKDSKSLLLWGSTILVLLVFSRNFTKLIFTYLSARFSVTLQTKFGQLIHKKIINSSYQWFIDQQPTELILIFQWRSNIGSFLQKYLQLLTKLIVLSILFFTLISYNATTALPVLLGLGFLSGLIFKAVKPLLDKYSIAVKELNKKIFSEVSTTIYGYKDIKLLNAESFVTGRLKMKFNKVIIFALRKRLLTASPSLFLELIGYAVFGLVVTYLVKYSNNDLGDILAILSMMAVVYWRAMPMVTSVLTQQTSLRATIPHIQHVLNFIDTPSESVGQPSKNKSPLTDFKSLTLSKVSFTYNTSHPKVLNNLSFKINKGEKIGIIGSSGCGKTTLIDIISGLLSPSEGTIFFNDVQVSNLDETDWSKNTGYLPQHPFIFPSSIDENIAFGVPHKRRDYDKLNQSIKAVKLEEVYQRDSEKKSPLIERGKNLSGGQCQRLAMARLFYFINDFIIIDEGTSALDSTTERFVLQNLIHLSPKSTILLITHRVATLSLCDKIIWLENGMIHMFDDAEIVINSYEKEQTNVQNRERTLIIKHEQS